ncbi:hypothetical protein B0I35DRAFT_196166 [Stachybotrys elegans]|uniref:Uncharacterized protein n=1 Tax=Stachybotrys elegans TaxID=80388 RepID=A0A8K0SCW6_9HYPO|nr:hypothetical protein B0I35DRAFT_196166 [Stachybotrys elegans]
MPLEFFKTPRPRSPFDSFSPACQGLEPGQHARQELSPEASWTPCSKRTLSLPDHSPCNIGKSLALANSGTISLTGNRPEALRHPSYDILDQRDIEPIRATRPAPPSTTARTDGHFRRDYTSGGLRRRPSADCNMALGAGRPLPLHQVPGGLDRSVMTSSLSSQCKTNATMWLLFRPVIPLRDTRSEEGIYRLLVWLERLKRWAEQEYWPHFGQIYWEAEKANGNP